jgi:hypothetical protein
VYTCCNFIILGIYPQLLFTVLLPISGVLLFETHFNSLNAELNPICHLLALLGAHHILHVSKIRVKEIFRKNCNKYISLPVDVLRDFRRVGNNTSKL